MKFPSFRIFLTVVLFLTFPVFTYTYETFKPQVEASAVVAQLEDSDLTYGLSKRVIVSQLIPNIYYMALIGSLLLVWGSWMFFNRKVLFS